MRHDDSIYFRWLRAESLCRSVSHRLYLLAQAGARPPDSLLSDFARSIDEAHESSRLYLRHLTELVQVDG